MNNNRVVEISFIWSMWFVTEADGNVRETSIEMTHRFRPQKDCEVAIGDFFPHAFPLRPDQAFSVMFGGAHNRAEFAPATA